MPINEHINQTFTENLYFLVININVVIKINKNK